MAETTTHATCPLCEATCGLEFSLSDGLLTRIRGDQRDVFSAGFICPKGASLADVDADPDRVRTPLLRRDRKLEPARWDDAFGEIERRLVPLVREYGPQSVGVYIGNPPPTTFRASSTGGC